MTILRLDHETFHWASGTGGASAVRRIAAEAEAYDGRAALNEQAQLTLHNHGLATGVVLLGGRQGFAYLHGLSGPGRPELELVVAPESRRQGLGTALLEALLELAPEIPLTAWSHGDHPGAAPLGAKGDFKATRELWLMRRHSQPVTLRDLPQGVTVRPFEVGRDESAFLAVNAAAFADHPEQGELDRMGLDDRIDEPWFDTAGFFVAVDKDGRVVGFHWTKVHPADAGDTPGAGEVYVIGVAPDWQGTGLGHSLLMLGLAHLQEQSVEEIVLYVEADNRTAVELYDANGFEHRANDTDVMYSRL